MRHETVLSTLRCGIHHATMERFENPTVKLFCDIASGQTLEAMISAGAKTNAIWEVCPDRHQVFEGPLVWAPRVQAILCEVPGEK